MPAPHAPRRLWCDRRAATAVEYGLVAALIAVALVASFKSLGNTTASIWGNVSSKVIAACGY